MDIIQISAGGGGGEERNPINQGVTVTCPRSNCVRWFCNLLRECLSALDLLPFVNKAECWFSATGKLISLDFKEWPGEGQTYYYYFKKGCAEGGESKLGQGDDTIITVFY